MQIGHALQEYASGFKVENSFSMTNLASQWVIYENSSLVSITDDTQLLRYNNNHSDPSRKSPGLCRAPADRSVPAHDVSFFFSRFFFSFSPHKLIPSLSFYQDCRPWNCTCSDLWLRCINYLCKKPDWRLQLQWTSREQRWKTKEWPTIRERWKTRGGAKQPRSGKARW